MSGTSTQHHRSIGSRSRLCRKAIERAKSFGLEGHRWGTDNSRMPVRAPVTKPDAARLEGLAFERSAKGTDTERQARFWKCKGDGSPKPVQDQSVHALVRVGSAAVPAPFAFGAGHTRPNTSNLAPACDSQLWAKPLPTPRELLEPRLRSVSHVRLTVFPARFTLDRTDCGLP
jgi:hypothetical protein